MFTISNLIQNPNIDVVQTLGAYTVLEHVQDFSLAVDEAQNAYFMSKMDVHKRQLLCDLSNTDVVLQAGAMQWTVGDVLCESGIKGVSDLGKKIIKGKATGETAVKPIYKGTGQLITEPTYKHLILMDLKQWGGSVVLDDGLFLACDAGIIRNVKARKSVSAAVLGGEGLFNLTLSGSGVFCIESPCAFQELVVVDLHNDMLRVDGNNAIAWSSDLEFTVETVSKSLLGSAATGEGFVNVYKGSGRVILKLT